MKLIFLPLGGTGGIIGDEYDNNFSKRENRIKKDYCRREN